MKDINDKTILDSVDFADFERRSGLQGFEAADFLIRKLNEILGSNHTRVCGSGGSLPTTHDKSGGAID